MKKRIYLLIFIMSFALGGCSGLEMVESTGRAQSPILIIDPGHGGEDGGAVAGDGSKESEINLAVSLKIEELCGFLGLNSVMTRTSEKLDYPETADTIRKKKVADQKARIELINSMPNAVLISVHQNMYPSKSPAGAQALYSKNQGSKELAELLQDNFSTYLTSDNKRSAAQISGDIYLMKKAECTAVLVECGFISNPNELALLKDAEYQKKIASVIMSSYTQFISETGNFYG